jgi:hypothetical protein
MEWLSVLNFLEPLRILARLRVTESELRRFSVNNCCWVLGPVLGNWEGIKETRITEMQIQEVAATFCESTLHQTWRWGSTYKDIKRGNAHVREAGEQWRLEICSRWGASATWVKEKGATKSKKVQQHHCGKPLNQSCQSWEPCVSWEPASASDMLSL